MPGRMTSRAGRSAIRKSIGKSMTTIHRLFVPAIGRRKFAMLGGAAALLFLVHQRALAIAAVPDDRSRLHV